MPAPLIMQPSYHRCQSFGGAVAPAQWPSQRLWQQQQHTRRRRTPPPVHAVAHDLVRQPYTLQCGRLRALAVARIHHAAHGGGTS